MKLRLAGERKTSGRTLLDGCIDKYVREGHSSWDESDSLRVVLAVVEDGVCLILDDLDNELEATEFISDESMGISKELA